MPRRYLSDFSEGRDNNFDFLRFLFAVLVIVSHSFPVLYYGSYAATEPLARLTHLQASFGATAVNMFFLISGYLVTRSWIFSKGIVDFTRRRLLRIVPALVVVLLLTVFVLGPIVTTERSTYFQNPETYRYFLVLFHVSVRSADHLPGVFHANPQADQVNTPLWTIRLELICYALVAVLGLLGAYKRRTTVLVLAVAGALLVNVGTRAHIGDFQDPFRVLVYFLVGMFFCIYRDHIPMSSGFAWACAAILILADLIGVLSWAMPVCLSYLIFSIAFNPNIRLQRFAKHGDLSYGVYLYAYPIQQWLAFRLGAHLNALTLTLLAMGLACMCAALSWRFVEKPALDLKKKTSPTLHETPVCAKP